MNTFKAFRIDKTNDNGKETIVAGFNTLSIDDLTEGEVVVKVAYSDINYKDALAATGKGKILRKYPLNGGIDLSGTVVSSSDVRFSEGDKVFVCGALLSELYDGGYAEYARVRAETLLPLPPGFSLRDVMAIGTAGFTAALAILRMEDNGQHPALGPILVTGATGGVGSYAINLLSRMGYEVHAFTGKPDQYGYLERLGATACVDRRQTEFGRRPLEKACWGGAVDNVGGDTLAWLTRTVVPWGSIASVGLAGGIELNTTVMPFILRGVSLLGINSIEMPAPIRDRAWQRLSTDWKPDLELVAPNTIDFEELPAFFEAYLQGNVVGRTVVAIDPSQDA